MRDLLVEVASSTALSDAEIEALVAQRSQAKTAKNWAEADRIRDELTSAGIVLKDGPDGTTWQVKEH